MSAAIALPLRVYEYWLMQYRRVWRGTVITSIINPVFYLGALGVGLGSLVNKSGGAPLGVSYIDFVAPGMLAAAAMQIATAEASWPVMGSFRWTRQYFAMIATPLGVRDVVLGHQLWMLARLATTSTIYLAVIAAFGGVDSFWAILALPAAVLVGAAFTGPFAAYAATRDNEAAFVPINRFVVLPMFLFSGVFFPVSRLPLPLEWLAYATPLWHGVDLCRELTLGNVHLWRALGHAALLLALFVGGLIWAHRTYARRLFT
ncbi:MAG TPA: ABC transporter permease [Gaiellaceae bacterium]|jgi:lipooligosaccharide transport system permease protein|nr:ABC transporter permease [Gaiellaceae bacterium]HWJ44803.1 ABC transporter permease [Gaiellaceae bacterium]